MDSVTVMYNEYKISKVSEDAKIFTKYRHILVWKPAGLFAGFIPGR